MTLVNGLAVLDRGTFAGYGIEAGMHLGAWNNDPINPKPLSEYVIEDRFTKLVTNQDTGLPFSAIQLNDLSVDVSALVGVSEVYGELRFVADQTEEDEQPDGSMVTIATMKAIAVNTGESIVLTIPQIIAGEKVILDVPTFGIRVSVSTTGGETVFASDTIRDVIVEALDGKVMMNDAATITTIVPSGDVDLSNDLQDNDVNRKGWRVWNVPTQAQLNNDSEPPFSSWKPYVGEFSTPSSANLSVIQEAVEYGKAPLTLRDGKVVDRFKSTWTEWSVLKNTVMQFPKNDASQDYDAVRANGEVVFNYVSNLDPTRVSVYVNGIAQLKAAFNVDGKTVTVYNVQPSSEVTVIIRKYEPTAKELAFNPEIADDLTFQKQYQQDYEYVSQPVRDRDGSLSSTIYYFWVKNKTTPAVGKKHSVQAIAQELREGPENFLTFQNIAEGDGSKYYYDAITISGLSYIVTKDNTFKLRFTRDFTLRDDIEESTSLLKNVHTEWALMRFGQKTRIPESLWNKIVDSVAGEDAAGNVVPAIRRVLYDERNGTRTQFGFSAEQTLAPAELLKSSITHTILNTTLINESSEVHAPDYITFLDFDQSDTWFADAANSRKTMTDIWNQATVAQVNEIFFAALNDILASNYELSDIFKTSRISAYSIKIVPNTPVAPTFE